MWATDIYDVWQKSGAEPGFVDFRESVKAINENPVMAAEMLLVTGRKILLFVRERNRDEYGLAMSYGFLGEAGFVKSYGARPMNIEWRLADRCDARPMNIEWRLADRCDARPVSINWSRPPASGKY